MRKTRFVRTLVLFVMLGLGGFLIGCSGESSPTLTPDKKEANKKIAEDFKNSQLQQKAARAQGTKDSARGGGRP